MNAHKYILSHAQYEYDFRDTDLLVNDLHKHAKKREPQFPKSLHRLQQGGWCDKDLTVIQSAIDSFLSSDPIGFEIFYTTYMYAEDNPPIDDSEDRVVDIQVTRHHLDGEYLMWLLIMSRLES